MSSTFPLAINPVLGSRRNVSRMAEASTSETYHRITVGNWSRTVELSATLVGFECLPRFLGRANYVLDFRDTVESRKLAKS